jgi:sulfhydrogenase subunit alpha
MKRSISVKVGALARVEGEGALDIRVAGGRVTQVKLRIFEPPRLFEALLRGRSCLEVPDIVARICGICPVAYQMSSVTALESALGIAIDPAVRELRRLLYCGEWIESHALHVAMLHAPDFLGYPDVILMARDHPERVRQALELKKTGNELMAILGGREIHPVSVRVGGFTRVPARGDLRDIGEKLRRARDLAVEMARFVAGFEFPEFEQDYLFVSLSHPGEYPLVGGRIVSSGGLDIPIEEYPERFSERHVPHSTALHSVLGDGGAGASYLVGPLARFNLNFDRLPAIAKDLARECGVVPPVRNPFRSIVVRALETVFACEEAIRIIGSYTPPAHPYVDAPPRAGVGHGASEAPRGVLYHRYEIDSEGIVVSARIVPPTSQNQGRIEEDVRNLVPTLLDRPVEELTKRCEQAVRNYDPCISCATHFLRVNIERVNVEGTGEGGAEAAEEP